MRSLRVHVVFFFLLLFGAIIIGRLVFVQIIDHDFYKALAIGQQRLSELIKPERGEIFAKDKDGLLYVLATSNKSKFVFVSPNKIDGDKEEIAEKLSLILDIEKEEIFRKLNVEDSFFVVLKKRLTEKEVEEIEKLEIEGIFLEDESFRYYPEEDFISRVLGFVGGEKYGQYGLEAFYEDQLKGIEGIAEGERSSRGYMVFFDPEKSLPASPGSDLVLEIDYYIQFKAEELLKEAKENLDIEGGQIIVSDPNSGKIIALASLANFNPNNYSDYELEVFMNPVSQKLFEPGSVFKPLTMAVGIEEDLITPQTTYYDEGFVKVGPDTIYNYNERVFGETTMTEVLEKSINTGAVFVEQQIPHNVFLDYIEEFGIFSKTGIDLQGEVFSTNEELKKGYEVNFATAAFGQGIEMTPVQLIRSFSIFANGGNILKPYLVGEIRGSDGSIIKTKTEIQRESVISEATASKITAMLVSVIEEGFGKQAKIPGYYIAGKTGTAQVPWSALGIDRSGYSEKTIQTFIGFAPAFNPRFLVLVKLDNPKTRTAEYSAVPVFRDLAKYIVDYYQIPPDYED